MAGNSVAGNKGIGSDRLRLHVLVPLLLLGGWAYGVAVHRDPKPMSKFNAIGSWTKGEIDGKVTRRGAPAAGIQVMLFGEPSIAARTGADGSFHLTNVPQGIHIVMASLTKAVAKDWTDQWISANVVRGVQTPAVELKLVQGAKITGKVLDPKGHLVTKGRIGVYRREPDGGMWGDFTEIAQNGSFSMRVPSGDWLVEELPSFGKSSMGFQVISWNLVTVAEGESKAVLLREIQKRA